MSYECYDRKKAFRIIIDKGVLSKNQKAIAECLEEVAFFISQEGIDGHVKKKDLEHFLKTCEMPDKSCRENSLKVFGEIYSQIGEEIWKLLKKDIPLKVKGLLE